MFLKWKKQRHINKTALVCGIILSLLFILGLGAYLIIPDNTQNANIQVPLIALKPPGFIQQFIARKKNITPESRSYLHLFLFGKSDTTEKIPISSYQIAGDEVIAIYGEGVNTYKLVDLIDRVNTLKPIEEVGGILKYEDIKGNIQKVEAKKATEFIERNHISHQTFWLGTDKFGRDNLSRLILGVRISLFIGLLSVIISVSLGVLIGSIGGYYGGWIDRTIMLLINTSWSIPTLLLAFAIIIAFGKGLLVIFLAIGLTMWVDVARIVRGQVMQIKNELFVKSSRVLGFRDYTIISRHILPNILGPLLVISAANFATAILVESGLSYLGLGIQPPTPSLGNLLKENYAYATGGFVYLAIFPILTIMTLVLSFNLLGTALRDVFDTKNT